MRLYTPRKDGSTLAEHALSVLEQVGTWPEDIPEPPEIPFGLQHVWEAYWEIRSGMGAGFSGPCPISHTEMRAWNSNTESGFNSRHFALLKAMDAAYMESWNKAQNK